MEGGSIGREMEEFIKGVVSLGTLEECVLLRLCAGSHFTGFTDRQITSADTHGHKTGTHLISQVPEVSLSLLTKKYMKGNLDSLWIYTRTV